MNESRIITIIILSLFALLIFSNCNPLPQSSNKSSSDSTAINDSIQSDFANIGNQLLKTEKFGDLKLGLSYHNMVYFLGYPSKTSEPELWEADGKYHQTIFYQNKGIELDLIGKDTTDQTINMITISTPSRLRTNSGMYVGCNINSVKTAYNNLINHQFSDSNQIVVGSIYGGLVFIFENNKVKKILLGSLAE
jgi:hypothetical protein